MLSVIIHRMKNLPSFFGWAIAICFGIYLVSPSIKVKVYSTIISGILIAVYFLIGAHYLFSDDNPRTNGPDQPSSATPRPKRTGSLLGRAIVVCILLYIFSPSEKVKFLCYMTIGILVSVFLILGLSGWPPKSR